MRQRVDGAEQVLLSPLNPEQCRRRLEARWLPHQERRDLQFAWRPPPAGRHGPGRYSEGGGHDG
jgi:hypothetical protein